MAGNIHSTKPQCRETIFSSCDIFASYGDIFSSYSLKLSSGLLICCSPRALMPCLKTYTPTTIRANYARLVMGAIIFYRFACTGSCETRVALTNGDSKISRTNSICKLNIRRTGWIVKMTGSGRRLGWLGSPKQANVKHNGRHDERDITETRI